MDRLTASNLFLEKSYQTILEDYMYSLSTPRVPTWDFVFITASNETQAESYRMQIEERIHSNYLHKQTKYIVIPDPEGKRVGSGGATLNVLKRLRELVDDVNDIYNKKILVIHSGGDSRRIPQYSICGKLFSPVPRMLPDGRRSVLFDEIIISLSALPNRMNHGMFTISGDVLMLFNPFQIDLKLNKSAVAISIKESVDTGIKHGVFLSDGKGLVTRFLHKQSADELKKAGAVDSYNNIDLDTGAIWFNKDIINALFSLISDGNEINTNKFNKMVNDEIRLSYYGDFLFPLAGNASFDEYLSSVGEVPINEKLLECRKQIWEALSDYNMSITRMSPAKFIHFGTTRELHHLVSNITKDYSYLGWSKNVLTNVTTDDYAASNSYISPKAKIGSNCYVEDSYIGANVSIGDNSIVSNLRIDEGNVPENIVLHGVELKSNEYCVRVYGIDDNPKENNLWTEKLHPVCDTSEDAIKAALKVSGSTYNYLTGLEDSFKNADIEKILLRKTDLEDIIRTERFVKALDKRVDINDAVKILGNNLSSELSILLSKVESYDFSLKLRVYQALSYISKVKSSNRYDMSYLHFEDKCYETLKNEIAKAALKDKLTKLSFKESALTIKLPVRVNWGGGWSDTLPFSTENGGMVLNAAIKLNGKNPVCVTVKKIKEKIIRFNSIDLEETQDITSKKELLNLSNPADAFLIHKGALIVTGIVNNDDKPLDELLTDIDGGIDITSNVEIPKGSGLGTSSIFAGACVKALYKIFGIEFDEQKIFSDVLLLEQLIGAGGGWQDQVGALAPGIKFITSKPGAVQHISIENIDIPVDAYKELSDRFVLIYSGQQRFARNILREIMNKYLLSDTQTLDILEEIQYIAIKMKTKLKQGNIQGFAALLNTHYELSKQLDKGSSNSSIDLIFELCSDLIDGKFICGAGGGGFLQVILKRGVSKDALRERIDNLFHGSGVEVWTSEFV